MEISSIALFGRDHELAEAEATLTSVATGAPHVLLVGGDAGIGKTSLIAALEEMAADHGFRFLVGHCLDINNGAPLQAVRGALRPVVAAPTTDDFGPVTRRLADFLLSGVPEAALSPGSLVDDLCLMVGELASESPLVFVLEDMHWAHRSTQDFAVALSGTMKGTVCLVLTYRSDELTRRHPFRRALVEIGRSPGARRIELSALDSDSLSDIVELRTGRRDAVLSASLLTRSEGNPLYAEELLEAREGALPGPLNDLLLARVDALSGPTRDLLRLASVNGSRIDASLLARVAGVDDDALDTCLREALDGNVLRVVGEHVDFRHGLMREAVYDDLLPGERTRAHARTAETLQHSVGEQPGLVELGLLAHHWYAAHELPAAYRASERAGLAARTYGAPEAIVHLERALELYDSVPSAEVGDRTAKTDLLRLLAEACREHFEHERADQFINEALNLAAEETDPLAASRVYASYVALGVELPGQPSHGEAIERAVAAAEGQPTEELANALSVQASWHLRQEQMAAAIESAERSIQVAAAVPVPVIEVASLQHRGFAHLCFGMFDVALRDFESATRTAQQCGRAGAASWSEIGQALIFIDGVDPVRGRALAEEFRTRFKEQGQVDLAVGAGTLLVHSYVLEGRLDEADRLLSVLVEEGMAPIQITWTGPQSRMLLLRGSAQAALALQRERMEQISSVASLPNWFEVLDYVEVLVANDLIEEALVVARQYATIWQHSDSPLAHGGIACTAFLTIQAAERAGQSRDDDLLGQADDLLARAEAALPEAALDSWEGSHTLIARARRAELFGEPSVDAWRSSCAASTTVGAGHALQARLGLVGALLVAGQREEPRLLLPQLWADARAMGAGGVVTQAERLALRHRIALPAHEQEPSLLDVLTPREREVLDVLVTGATNRVIAERLFISEKTVSVHVTNLLAKLGVANRGEAAALARELAPAD